MFLLIFIYPFCLKQQQVYIKKKTQRENQFIFFSFHTKLNFCACPSIESTTVVPLSCFSHGHDRAYRRGSKQRYDTCNIS